MFFWEMASVELTGGDPPGVVGLDAGLANLFASGTN